jgi:hypothetical protein
MSNIASIYTEHTKLPRQEDSPSEEVLRASQVNATLAQQHANWLSSPITKLMVLRHQSEANNLMQEAVELACNKGNSDPAVVSRIVNNLVKANTLKEVIESYATRIES